MTYRNYAIYDPKTRIVLATINVHDDDKHVLKKIKAKEVGDEKIKIGYEWDEETKKFTPPIKLLLLRKWRAIRKKNVPAVEEK